ncbi:hypothetical protein ACFCXS_33930 [Streptomyces sp. NPDC056373]
MPTTPGSQGLTVISVAHAMDEAVSPPDLSTVVAPCRAASSGILTHPLSG